MAKISVIGSGFAGMSCATFLAEKGHDVTIHEKHTTVGGRARIFQDAGFTYDMGPSWYWMPDVFERYFAQFGKKVEEYYDLIRLSPSYRVFFKDGPLDIPAEKQELFSLFESLEPGSSKHLDSFLREAEYKYQVGVNKLVYKPSMSIFEFLDSEVLRGLFRLQLLNSIASHIHGKFKHPKLRAILEFPCLFLGGTPQNTPALYSLMNYADLELGTWYPMGGMHNIPEAMSKLALEMGVKFDLGNPINSILVNGKKAEELITSKGSVKPDLIVSGADYHHTEMLLPKASRSYSDKFWDSRVMAPSALIFYLGINRRVNGLLHHNLFFDEDFQGHAHELYNDPKWPTDPLFYTCVPSVTDPGVAPEGMENIFILVPIAPDLEDSDELHEKYLDMILRRIKLHTGEDLRKDIISKRSFSVRDFKSQYNSFKGNAYGMANTLKQTAFLKPLIKSKKLSNMYYTGQLTVPGPGVPPALISGEVVANYVNKKHAA